MPSHDTYEDINNDKITIININETFSNEEDENKDIYCGNINGPTYGANEIYIRNNCKKKVEYILILIIIIFLLLINKLIYKLYLYKYSYKKCQSLK